MFNKKILNVAISGAVTTLALQSTVAQSQEFLSPNEDFAISRPTGYFANYQCPVATAPFDCFFGTPETIYDYDTNFQFGTPSLIAGSAYYGTVSIGNSGYISNGGNQSQMFPYSVGNDRDDAFGISINPGGLDNVDDAAGLYGSILLDTTGGVQGTPPSPNDGGTFGGTGAGYIDVFAEQDYAFATGIYVGGDIQTQGLVSLDNGASIYAGALGGVAQGTGIAAQDLEGTIYVGTNAWVVGEGIASAVAVSTGIDLQGGITSTGELIVDGGYVGGDQPWWDYSILSESTGVSVGDDVDGLIVVDQGAIAAWSSAVQDSNATALSIDGDLNGELLIYGTDAPIWAGGDGLFAQALGENTSFSDAHVEAAALAVGDINGLLVNDATIYGEAAAWPNQVETAVAHGIVGGDVTGEVINTGDIAADAGYGASASATAISLGQVGTAVTTSSAGETVTEVTGSLINYGFVGAYAQGVDVDATGISTGDVVGTIGNAGIVGGYASGEFADAVTASGTGVAVLGDVSGEVLNAGWIVGIGGADFNGEATASGVGIRVDGDVSGLLLNAGETMGAPFTMISGEAYAYSGDSNNQAMAAGIDIGSLSGELVNQGYVDARAFAGNGGAEATAVALSSGDISGALTNSGSMYAYAEADNAMAYGASVGNISGSVDNSGSIFGEAGFFDSGDDYAQAMGFVAGDLSGVSSLTGEGEMAFTAATFTNSGTISAQASASSSEFVTASATGAQFGAVSGTLTNTGAISAYAFGEDAAEVSASAVGLAVGDVSGEVELGGELGTVSAHADARYASYVDASAVGVLVDGDIGVLADGEVSGSVSNSGEIYASAHAYSGGSVDAQATGVSAGDVLGSLTNSGTVGVSATAWSDATATGISVGAVSGSVSNSGELSVYASASDAYASGIVAGNVSGSISTSGTLSVTADGFDNGTAYGVMAGDVSGEVLTSGVVSVSASADPDYYATAIGVDLGEVTGDVLNSGELNVSATAGDATYAVGIALDALGGVDVEGEFGTVFEPGTVTNTAMGSITVSANAASEVSIDAFATGIYVGGATIEGDITNAGSISVTASAMNGSADTMTVSAYGIVGENVAGNIVNSGTLSVTAEAGGELADVSDSEVYAYGIDVGDVTGEILNSGTLTVSASATGSATDSISVSAVGIDAWDIDGSVTNSGTLTVSASATGSATDSMFVDAVGIDAWDIDGSVTNSGTMTVTATGADDAYAAGIEADDVDGTSSLSAGGEMVFTAASLTNTATGVISVTAISSGSDNEDAWAYGITVSDVYGAVSNAGEISVAAQATAGTYDNDAEAFGIIASDVYGSVSNSGDITVQATAAAPNWSAGNTGSALGVGIDVAGLYGSIESSGDITVGVMGENAVAVGIGSNDVMGTGTVVPMGGMMFEVMPRAESAGTVAAVSGSSGEAGESTAMMASIDNSGTITVSATATSSSATGYGIVTGSIFGSVNNSGEISVTADSEADDANAVGMLAFDGVLGATEYTTGGEVVGFIPGSLTNSGTISVLATAADSASAGGMGTYWVNLGTVENSGSLSVTANGEGADATGMGVGANWVVTDIEYGYTSMAGEATSALPTAQTSVASTGTLVNTATGSIVVSAAADGWDADATGMYAGSTESTVENAGEITVSASSQSSDAVAEGIYVGEVGYVFGDQGTYAVQTSLGEVVGGSFPQALIAVGGVENSGDITVSATVAALGDYDSAYAYGIYVNSDLNGGAIANSGEVSVTSQGEDAHAYGINAGDVDLLASYTASSALGEIYATGSITNSATGVIDVHAHSYGEVLIVDGEGEAILDGEGEMQYSSATYGHAYAVGIGAGYVDGSITNAGEISVHAEAYGSSSANADADAFGIRSYDVSGSVVNSASGSISVSATGADDADAFGIDVDSVEAMGLVSNEGSINVSVTTAGLDADDADGWGIRAYNVGRESTSTSTYYSGASYYTYFSQSSDTSTGATVVNSGSITLDSSAADNSDLYGIRTSSVGGAVINDEGATIDVNAHADDDAYAFGIYTYDVGEDSASAYFYYADATSTSRFEFYTSVASDGTGSVTNHGTVNVSASAADRARAAGIDVGDVGGSVSNSGAINVVAAGNGAFATGIEAGSVGVVGEYSWVYDRYQTEGVLYQQSGWLNFDAVDGYTASLTNSGEIDVDATGASYAYADGINTNEVNGTLTNSGSVEVSASAEFYADAAGLTVGEVGVANASGYGYGYTDGTYSDYQSFSAEQAIEDALVVVTEGATVDVDATASGSWGTAYAVGIDAADVLGTVRNDGTITVDATGAYATATGVDAYDVGVADYGLFSESREWVVTTTVSGAPSSYWGSWITNTSDYGSTSVATATVSNTGSLMVVATGEYGAIATGVDASDIGGAVLNSGNLDVTASVTDSSGYATASGLYLGDILETGVVANSGEINVSAHGGTNGDASAWGMDLGDIDGTVTNSGSMSVTAQAEYADAWGIEVDDIGETGSITNSAGALIDVKALGDDSMSAYGIVADSLAGSITNMGTINVLASGSYESYAEGIAVYNDVASTGSIINGENAMITVTADAGETGDTASAFGIYVDGDLDGSIENHGEISVSADAGSDYSAYAFGVLIDNDINGSLVNRGTLSVTADASSATEYASAYGVLADDVGGEATVQNWGTITVNATGNSESSAYAYGIYLDDIDGSVINNGVLDVTASNSQGDEAYAQGITAYEVNDDGSIVNGGEINVFASATDDTASAVGIWVRDDVGGSVSNSGDIAVTATGSYEAYASGIYVGDNVFSTGSIVNAEGATITVMADAGELGDTAWAVGIGVYDDVDGSVENHGSVDVSAYAGSDYDASAYGIYVGDDVYGSVANSGSVAVLADAARGTDTAYAYGIDVEGNVYGSVSNSGSVSVTAIANSDDDASAYGFLTGTIVGEASLTNSGTLDVLAEGGYETYAYGIVTNHVDGEVVNDVDGSITVEAHSMNLGEATADTASAAGIDTGYVDGLVANHGEITVRAIAGGTYYATAAGIDTWDVAGEVVNMGSISVFASGANNTDSVQAFGIDTGMVSGSVTNAGTLTAQAVAGGSDAANAYGVQAWGVTADGAISNSGSLSVMATNSGSSRAFAAGIHTEDGDMAGLVENTGTLYVSATAGSATASAIGIFGENAVSGTISNEGMIWAAASGPEAYAVGIGAMDVTGTGEIVNSGTVLASATGSSGQAWGIAALNLDGAIVNSGYVAASGIDESWALYVADGAGSISNATAGTIAGDFEIQASGVTFMNSGLLDLGYADAYHAGDFVEYGSGVLSIIVDSDDASDYGSLTIGGASNMMNADGAAAVLQVDISGFTTGLTGATVIEDVITFTDAGYDMSDDEYELDINETSYILDFAVVKDDDNTVDIMAYIDYDGGHSVWQQVQPTYWQTAKGVSQQFDYLIENPNTASAGMMGIIDYFVQQTDGLPVYEAALANIPLFSGATGHAVRDAMRETSNAVADRARAQSGMSAGNGIVSDKNLWIKPILATAEQDATDGAAGYDADGTGFVLGLDGSINNDMARIGVAVAYTSTDMNSTSGPAHASDVKGTQLMAYVSHSFNAATQLRASADWGTNRAHSMRDIDVFDKVARGRFDIDTFHLGVGLDRAFTLSDRLDAVASVAFDYSKIEVDSFTETGAGPLNQSYAARDYTSAVLGLEGQFVYALNSGTSLIGRAGLAYDSENEMASSTTQFVGSGTTFLTEGIESDPMIGRLGVGVERQLEGDLSVSFNYDVETRDGYTEQAASMKLRWEF